MIGSVPEDSAQAPSNSVSSSTSASAQPTPSTGMPSDGDYGKHLATVLKNNAHPSTQFIPRGGGAGGGGGNVALRKNPVTAQGYDNKQGTLQPGPVPVSYSQGLSTQQRVQPNQIPNRSVRGSDAMMQSTQMIPMNTAKTPQRKKLNQFVRSQAASITNPYSQLILMFDPAHPSGVNRFETPHRFPIDQILFSPKQLTPFHSIFLSVDSERICVWTMDSLATAEHPSLAEFCLYPESSPSGSFTNSAQMPTSADIKPNTGSPLQQAGRTISAPSPDPNASSSSNSPITSSAQSPIVSSNASAMVEARAKIDLPSCVNRWRCVTSLSIYSTISIAWLPQFIARFPDASTSSVISPQKYISFDANKSKTICFMALSSGGMLTLALQQKITRSHWYQIQAPLLTDNNLFITQSDIVFVSPSQAFVAVYAPSLNPSQITIFQVNFDFHTELYMSDITNPSIQSRHFCTVNFSQTAEVSKVINIKLVPSTENIGAIESVLIVHEETTTTFVPAMDEDSSAGSSFTQNVVSLSHWIFTTPDLTASQGNNLMQFFQAESVSGVCKAKINLEDTFFTDIHILDDRKLALINGSGVIKTYDLDLNLYSVSDPVGLAEASNAANSSENVRENGANGRPLKFHKVSPSVKRELSGSLSSSELDEKKNESGNETRIFGSCASVNKTCLALLDDNGLVHIMLHSSIDDCDSRAVLSLPPSSPINKKGHYLEMSDLVAKNLTDKLERSVLFEQSSWDLSLLFRHICVAHNPRFLFKCIPNLTMNLDLIEEEQRKVFEPKVQNGVSSLLRCMEDQHAAFFDSQSRLFINHIYRTFRSSFRVFEHTDNELLALDKIVQNLAEKFSIPTGLLSFLSLLLLLCHLFLLLML